MSIDDTALKHIAIVMDGNGRWAKKRFLPREAGHAEGVKALKNIIEACGRMGLKVLTIFAFSSENWQRPKVEVKALMGLFISSLEAEIKQLHENQVRIKFIGDLERFDAKLKKRILAAEQLTQENAGLVLNIAVSYGGRWDITQACRAVCEQLAQGKITLQDIDEDLINQNLTTFPLDEPDLFIRTAGEQRLSNFLVWQLAYTELYFTEALWPDFDVDELNLAIEQFSHRQRKFGLTQEQIDANKT